MDIHKNARLSFRSREELARYVVEQGVTRKAAAAIFRVSVKTAGKWVGRFQIGSVEGLKDRSSRPHHSPRQTHSLLVEKVLELRRGHMPGYVIARRTGLSPASVSRILRRARLSRWRDLNPPPPIQRYEHPRPGDLLHLDIKGMTRFGEVSLRGDGRLRGKKEHPGFLALHVAVDDHSRMAFTQMLPNQKADTTIAILHSRTKPYTPRTNGKAERFIQTALREWAYAKHWDHSDQRDAHLLPWTDYYNRERPHGSLQYKPPISRSEAGTTS